MPAILSTIVICLLLAAGLFFSIRKLWRDKKAGKTCCGGNCSVCHMCRNRESIEKGKD